MVQRDGDELFALPTLSTSVVDTIGCGDAYFALSSLAAGLALPGPASSRSPAASAPPRWRSGAATSAPISEQEFLTIGKIVI